jgi:Trypsin-like peptidase domain
MLICRRAAAVVTLVCAALGCSSSSSSASLPSFSDIPDAPPAIQTAAKAVVRIGTAGELATGFFISPTGLLLTNNHVLGVDLCAVSGCFASITQMHQQGAPPESPKKVFAVPFAVDVGLDMAVLQLYADNERSTTLDSPDYLTLDSRSPAALVGEHVYVVGHPEGRLKKWSQGQVYTVTGNWIYTTAYVLPGNSGSPLLDDHGNVVGLIHREPDSQDLISDNGVDEYSIGTASAPLVAAMSAPLPAVMRSLTDSTTEDDVVAHHLVYRNAQVTGAIVGGTSRPVLEILGDACNAALARDDYESPDDLASALTPCADASLWIECRSDAKADFKTCPSDVSSWLNRYQKLFDKYRAMNGQLEYSAITFWSAALAANMDQGRTDAASNLSAALAEAKPPLGFSLANYLAAFDFGAYEGTLVVDFVRNYRGWPGYSEEAGNIASAALYLSDASVLSVSDARGILGALGADPSIDIGDRLYIEEVLYNSGAP